MLAKDFAETLRNISSGISCWRDFLRKGHSLSKHNLTESENAEIESYINNLTDVSHELSNVSIDIARRAFQQEQDELKNGPEVLCSWSFDEDGNIHEDNLEGISR